MANAVFSGMAVTSHNDGILSAASFDRVVGIVGTPAPPSGPLPAPWQSIDVGLIGVAGGAGHSNGVFTVGGSGEGIWGTADAFHFLHRSWTGDVELITRITNLQDTAAWAKAGVMIRETLEADAPGVVISLTPQHGASLQSRVLAGSSTTLTRGPGLAGPAWLKLMRRGNDFAGSVSDDGVLWSHVGTHTVSLNATTYIGLAVSSFDNSRLNTAQFRNVVVQVPQPPFTVGVEEPNWPVQRIMPRVSLISSRPAAQFTLKVEDHPGHRHELQHSTDLYQWHPAAFLDNRGGVSFFTDSLVSTQRQRFYRVSLSP